MSSRDGVNFQRWGEAFIRPGLRERDNWVYGDNCVGWGVVETKSDIPGAPNELSIYATESYWTGTSLNLRRYTLRLDGFVSMQAPLSGGEFVTKPLIFTGDHLIMNYSTSAAGSIRVEVQDEAGRPLEGLTLDDSIVLFGDSLEQKALWKDTDILGHLARSPVSAALRPGGRRPLLDTLRRRDAVTRQDPPEAGSGGAAAGLLRTLAAAARRSRLTTWLGREATSAS